MNNDFQNTHAKTAAALPAPSALSFKQLCLLLDCKQAIAVKRVMKKCGIRWSLDRNGKPWTTAAELERIFTVNNRVLSFTKPPSSRPKRKST